MFPPNANIKVDNFIIIVSSKPLNIVAKCSILDICGGLGYASGLVKIR